MGLLIEINVAQLTPNTRLEKEGKLRQEDSGMNAWIAKPALSGGEVQAQRLQANDYCGNTSKKTGQIVN